MSAVTEMYIAGNLAGIVPVGNRDLNSDDVTAQNKGGTYAFMVDAFGPRLFRYGRNVSGSAAAYGELHSRYGSSNRPVTAITNLTSGTVYSGTKSSSMTAGKHAGALAYVLDAASSAGAAPEGECSPIVSHDTNTFNVDRNYPYSVALAANDDIDIYSTYQFQDAAASDPGYMVFGVVVAKDSISDGNFGWVQSWGLCPNVLVRASTGLTAGAALIAHTGRVDIAGASSVGNLHIGTAVNVVTSDIVSDRTTCMLTLDFGYYPATIDTSA